MPLVVLHFRIDGALVGETKAGAVPAVGDEVTIEHGIRGRIGGRVTRVNHQYTDSGARRADMYVPAPVVIDLKEER